MPSDAGAGPKSRWLKKKPHAVTHEYEQEIRAVFCHKLTLRQIQQPTGFWKQVIADRLRGASNSRLVHAPRAH